MINDQMLVKVAAAVQEPPLFEKQLLLLPL